MPRVLVWDGEGAIGRWRAGRAELTAECQAFRGTLGAKVVVCKPADPEAKGMIERAHDYLERSFLPGRSFNVPADFNVQLRQWLAVVNTRPRRALGCARRTGSPRTRQAMLALPPVAPATGWRCSTRLARDHYVRLDSNDYSVHPAVIGRRIEVIADLDRVRVFCDGQGGRGPRAVLGLAPDDHRPGAPAAAEALRRKRVGRAAPGRRAARSSSAAWLTTTPRSGLVRMGGWRDGRRATRHGPGHDRRARVPDPGAESSHVARVGARLAERARAESWTMRSSWWRACSARSPPASPTAARAGSAPPVPGPQEPGGVRLRPRPRPATATSSRTWAPWTSSPRRTTWSSWARPAPARPTWPSAWPSGPARPGTGSLFATAAEWVARLAEAHHAGRLQAELTRLGRYPLLVIDEVGYIPFEPEAANLFFQLVSSRYERASLIVTSNKPFGRWGETFGDDVVAAAMIDRLVHHRTHVLNDQLAGDFRR